MLEKLIPDMIVRNSVMFIASCGSTHIATSSDCIPTNSLRFGFFVLNFEILVGRRFNSVRLL